MMTKYGAKPDQVSKTASGAPGQKDVRPSLKDRWPPPRPEKKPKTP
jgi:hypothetical protein